MDNLSDSGLILRTLELKNYAELIANLNYNFTQILQLPGFKGSKGTKGDDGDSQVGERGNLWYFAKLEQFNSVYGGTITSVSQLSLEFINVEYINDEELLLSALGAESLIVNDIIVLPSGSVIQLNGNSGLWEFSGITFEEANGVTTEEVQALIEQYIQGIGDGTSVFEFLDAHAKNVTDSDNLSGTNAGANYTAGTGSALDPNVPASGIGTNQPFNRFISPITGVINRDMKPTFITGSSFDYHDLVQKTLDQLSTGYAPGVGDSTALAVLQNNSDNGIVLGRNDATNGFRDFARFYKSDDGLNITSSFSPLVTEYSDLLLNDKYIKARALDYMTIDAPVTNFIGDINQGVVKAIDDHVTLGETNSESVEILNDLKLSKSGLQEAKILSTDSDGVVKKTYDVITEILDEDTSVVTADALYDFKEDVEAAIEALGGNVGDLNDNTFVKLSIGDLSEVTTDFNNYEMLGVSVLGYPNVDAINGSAIQATNCPFTITADSVSLLIFKNRSLESDEQADTITQIAINANPLSSFSLTEKSIHFRTGIKNASQSRTWSDWSGLVSDTYSVNVSNDLEGGGTFKNNEGAINIEHSEVPFSVGDTPTTSGNVIKSLTKNDYGHLTSVSYTDLDERYYTEDELSENEDFETAGARLVGVPLTETVEACAGDPSEVDVFDNIYSDNVYEALVDLDSAVSNNVDLIEKSSMVLYKQDTFNISNTSDVLQYTIYISNASEAGYYTCNLFTQSNDTDTYSIFKFKVTPNGGTEYDIARSAYINDSSYYENNLKYDLSSPVLLSHGSSGVFLDVGSKIQLYARSYGTRNGGQVRTSASFIKAQSYIVK